MRLNVRQHELAKNTMPWALEMKAVSQVEPSRLVLHAHRRHPRLRRMGPQPRRQRRRHCEHMLFEFERQACVDIYSILIAAGIELSQAGHLRFTELCQCTRNQTADCGSEIASVDLEVQTFPTEENPRANPSRRV